MGSFLESIWVVRHWSLLKLRLDADDTATVLLLLRGFDPFVPTVDVDVGVVPSNSELLVQVLIVVVVICYQHGGFIFHL